MNETAPNLTASSDLALLYRYLTATRPDFRESDGPEKDAARVIASRSFPGIDLGCEFVSIRSRKRRCEFRVAGRTAFIVIDLDLSDRMTELDLLAQIPAMKPDWVYAFFVVLLADAFRERNDLRRYRYCVLKAAGDTKSLTALSSLPKDGPPVHAGIIPVLLHELAHVAYRRSEGFVAELRNMCQAALSKVADVSAAKAATGRNPVPGGITLGVPFEEYDQERLKLQLEQYAETIRGNEELEEELTCDLISTLAFVNLESGINCFRELTPRRIPLSVRQLGDIFYLGIKTSRYLQILSGIRQFGVNVTAGVDQLHREIIEMTARTNALTHILLSLFQVQIEGSEFNEKPDFGRPLSRDEIQAGMHRSIEHLMRHHHNRLLGPFETLTEFFVTPDAFDQDDREVLSRVPGQIPVSFADVDTLRSALPF